MNFFADTDDAVAHDAAQLNQPLPPSASWTDWTSDIHLLIAILGALSSLVMVVYYTHAHRTTQTRWTTDQVNVCIIPLVFAGIFAVVYIMFR